MRRSRRLAALVVAFVAAACAPRPSADDSDVAGADEHLTSGLSSCPGALDGSGLAAFKHVVRFQCQGNAAYRLGETAYGAGPVDVTLDEPVLAVETKNVYDGFGSTVEVARYTFVGERWIARSISGLEDRYIPSGDGRGRRQLECISLGPDRSGQLYVQTQEGSSVACTITVRASPIPRSP
jgi:hypothetical protein